MSHIFDGLQRAEGERGGVGLSTLPEVTELLQRTERRVASQWNNTAQYEHSESQNPDHNRGLAEKLTPIVPACEVPVAPDLSLIDERRHLLNQFKRLEVSLTPQSRLPFLVDKGTPAAEAFRLLGVRLRNIQRDRPLKKVLITSTIPQEGKSMVAANLAGTLALKTDQKILVMEGDLRRPSLSRMFGIGRDSGLCELLENGGNLTNSIYHLGGANIWILPAGSTPSNALELLQSVKLTALMDQLTKLFDWIVIDSPPVLPLADTSVWMRLADGIILTTRQGTTVKRKLQAGLEALDAGKILGALVNSSTNASANDYYYYGSAGDLQPAGSVVG